MKYWYPVTLGSIVLFVGIYLSTIYDWYTLMPQIDKVYHLLAGVALGWFFYLYIPKEYIHATLRHVLIVVSTTCLVAVFWEYAERLSTLYSPTYMPWLAMWLQGGDLNDTLVDIFMAMLGALSIYTILHFSRH